MCFNIKINVFLPAQVFYYNYYPGQTWQAYFLNFYGKCKKCVIRSFNKLAFTLLKF